MVNSLVPPSSGWFLRANGPGVGVATGAQQLNKKPWEDHASLRGQSYMDTLILYPLVN